MVLDTTTIAGKTLVKLSDWIGGTGTKPTLNVGMWAVGDGTYTSTAADAQSIEGKNIINQNNRLALMLWSGTQSQYNAIPTKNQNTIYLVLQ